MDFSALKKPLGGEGGYKRLVRLLARAFYSGECPPKEASPQTGEEMTEAAKAKAVKVRRRAAGGGRGGAGRGGWALASSRLCGQACRVAPSATPGLAKASF